MSQLQLGLSRLFLLFLVTTLASSTVQDDSGALLQTHVNLGTQKQAVIAAGVQASLASWFSHADADGDGLLTRHEFDTWLPHPDQLHGALHDAEAPASVESLVEAALSSFLQTAVFPLNAEAFSAQVLSLQQTLSINDSAYDDAARWLEKGDANADGVLTVQEMSDSLPLQQTESGS